MVIMTDDLDGRLNELDQKIAQIINAENLKTQVDSSAANSRSINFNDLSKLQQRDFEITQELQQLRELWVVATLFKEMEVNLELFEFESVFYSLKNFQKKVKSDSFSSNSMIVEKLQNEHDRYYELAIEQVKESWNKLIEVNEDSITFNAEVEINGNLLLFENIVDVIKSNNLQSKIPNSNITHLIDQKLLGALVNSKTLELVDNKISILHDKPSIESQIQSVGNLANFISFLPDDQQVISYISPRLFEWLKEVITINIDRVHPDKQIQNQFLNLGSLLSEKNFKRNDLHNWIKNELNEIAVENYLDLRIDQVRTLTKGLNKSTFQTLLIRETQDTIQTKEVPKIHSEPEPAQKQQGDDDWGWDDENISFDGEEPKQVEAEDDFKDDWDWNDEEEEQPKTKNKLVSKLAKKNHSNDTSREGTPVPQQQQQQQLTTYQSTKLPEEINKILESYLSTQSKLPKQYHDLHYSKLNYLVTGFYILVSQEFKTHTTSPLLLYNDLTYLYQLSNIQRLVELKERYLDMHIKSFNDDIGEHYSKLDGLNPTISASETYKIIDDIQLIFTMFFKKLQILPSNKYHDIVSTQVEIFFETIIQSVFDKYEIGEIESEYLNLILNKFLELKFPIESNKIKNHSKLRHVAFIVNSHLKDIMESFYNAEFYDLSTSELIGLVQKLFADSDLRRRSIDDIKEIREAA